MASVRGYKFEVPSHCTRMLEHSEACMMHTLIAGLVQLRYDLVKMTGGGQ